MSSCIKDQIGHYFDRFYRPGKSPMHLFDMEVVADDTGYLLSGEMQITLGNSHKRELADPIDGGLTLQKILRVKKMLEERERHCATQNLTATEVRTRLEEQWLRDPLLDATIEAVQKRIRNFQQQKENSNMPVNEQQPEYSKNCAIKTLQQQLERAEENAKATLGNVNFYQNEKHCYEKKENEWRERLGADEKNVKEIKAALKKLGAGPRIITK